MTRCIIIGSKGYIGRHIEWYLKNNAIIPICYDVIPANDENYNCVNLLQKESIKKIDLNVDFIFFIAGLTGTFAGFDNYHEYINVNEIGLLNLLDAIRESPFKPKIIFPSSRLVYKGKDEPLDEDSVKETKTIYAVNKLSCEGILYAYRNCFDIPYTVFRICVPYGNLLGDDYSFGTIGFFINKALVGENITLYGDGSIKRTFTHIADICNQIITVGMLTKSSGEIYNIGGETLSLREAALGIAEKFKVKVISTQWPKIDLKIESGHTYFDDSKIIKLIGGYEYRKYINFINDISI